MGILIILVFFAAAWFLLIVPRQRELRRHQAVLAAMAVGDEVVTASGIYGTIRSIEDDVVELEVAPTIVLKIARRAVAAMANPPESDAELVDLTEEAAGEIPESTEPHSDRPETGA
jgi:preprotein translocase subunit YajC